MRRELAGMRGDLGRAPDFSWLSLGSRRREAAGGGSHFLADLDRFKQINDSFGHAVGDGALRLASPRFDSVVRDSDTVSRHEGHELLVLLAGVSETSDAARRYWVQERMPPLALRGSGPARCQSPR